MKTSNNTLSAYRVMHTAFQTNGRKITKAAAAKLKKIVYWADLHGKTEFSIHDSINSGKPEEIAAILCRFGYTFRAITITDRQYKLTNTLKGIFDSFEQVATSKQKELA